MAQHYSNPERESDKYSLPDVETFKANYAYCQCGSLVFFDHYTSEDGQLVAECPEAGPQCSEKAVPLTKTGWFYWFCFPGCMPESDPMGPFETEADALRDARSSWE